MLFALHARLGLPRRSRRQRHSVACQKSLASQLDSRVLFRARTAIFNVFLFTQRCLHSKKFFVMSNFIPLYFGLPNHLLLYLVTWCFSAEANSKGRKPLLCYTGRAVSWAFLAKLFFFIWVSWKNKTSNLGFHTNRSDFIVCISGWNPRSSLASRFTGGNDKVKNGSLHVKFHKWNCLFFNVLVKLAWSGSVSFLLGAPVKMSST